MSNIEANSSRVLLISSLLASYWGTACSGMDWENQRLAIDVAGRQGSDRSYENTISSGHADSSSTSDAPHTGDQNDTLLEPESGFELCETALLQQHYARDPAFWLGMPDSKHYEVDGNGFFGALQDDAGEVHYSRSIDLGVASDGTLVDGEGRTLLGFSRGVHGETQCPSALRAPVLCSQQATTQLEVMMNLDSGASISWWDPQNPASSQATSSVLVYDSAGGGHWMEMYFVKVQDFMYTYAVGFDGADMDGGTPGTTVFVTQGSLTFDTNGALLDAQTPDVYVDFNSATPGQVIAVDFGQDINNDGGNGLSGTTSFDSATSVNFVNQDGHPPGTAVDVWLGARGVATVECSYGGSFEIGSVVLARFPDEGELAEASDGTFRQTNASGAPAFVPPGYPGRGLIE